MRQKTLRTVGLIGCVFLGANHAATGEQEKPASPNESRPDWSISTGIMGIFKPEYEGADEYEFMAFPLINLSWRDTYFLNPRTGAGAYFWTSEHVKLGASIGYTFGRDEDDSSDLNGLGDIDGGATGNLLLNCKAGKYTLNTRLEQQLTGQDSGFQANVSLGYPMRLGEKMMLKPALNTTYASANYLHEYFSISASQSVLSGLPAYEADAGFKSAGISLLALYRLNPNWAMQINTSYTHLTGDTADSPLVKSENQYFSGLGLSYTF